VSSSAAFASASEPPADNPHVVARTEILIRPENTLAHIFQTSHNPCPGRDKDCGMFGLSLAIQSAKVFSGSSSKNQGFSSPDQEVCCAKLNLESEDENVK